MDATETNSVMPAQQHSWLNWIALLTWGLVAYAALATEWQRKTPQPLWHSVLIVIVLLVFLIAMWRVIRVERHDRPLPFIWIPLQFLAVLALTVLVPNNGIVVLAIITSSQLPWLLKTRQAIIVIAMFVATHSAIQLFWWHDQSVWFEAFLYGAFHLFAYSSMYSVKNERDAKENLAKVNAELSATQHLLSQATRQAERLNISRNLHDVLGHHLTALSIQLEIAGHLSQGDAQVQIVKAQQLAKLLLADVRSAVSDLRESAAIDVPKALLALITAVPRLRIQYRWPLNWQVDDIAVAETILRVVQEALTNILRHSNADRCEITIEENAGKLIVAVRDNGGKLISIVEGNGLQGMRERVQKLSGDLQIDAAVTGLCLTVTLPSATAL